MSGSTLLKPGSLWSAIVERTRTALASGALKPIATDVHTIEDRGVRFQVRVVSSLVRKKTEIQARTAENGGRPVNPFLPYEEALFVGDISPTHVCLLNKYNVIEHHALIITRDFEPQESPLTLRDFAAVGACLEEIDALVFYNSDPVAGASQPHKHLQLIRLPLSESDRLPILPLLEPLPSEATVPSRAERLPFAHAIARLDRNFVASGRAEAEYLFGCYTALLVAAGLASKKGPTPTVLPPYNLLVTREFMLVIPRALPAYEGVPFNALGFAGCFFVAKPETMFVFEQIEPISLLQKVAVPL